MTYPDYASQPPYTPVPPPPAAGPAPAGEPLAGGLGPGSSPLAGAPYLQGGPGYPASPGYPGASGYSTAPGYPGYPTALGYESVPGYPGASGYQGAPGYQGASYPPGYAAMPVPLVRDPATVNCAVPWFLGLLVMLPLPFIGAIAGAAGPLVAGLVWKMEGATRGRTQARQAASWGLTFLLVMLVLAVARIWVFLAQVRSGRPETFSWGDLLAILTWVLLLLHIVVCAVGGVRASQGKTMPFYGIPFFR